jgi:magnesium chelatase subunit H
VQCRNEGSSAFGFGVFVAAWSVSSGLFHHTATKFARQPTFHFDQPRQPRTTPTQISATKYESDIAEVTTITKVDITAPKVLDSFQLDVQREPSNHDGDSKKITIVLVAGFERFNRNLYEEAIQKQSKSGHFNDKTFELIVFSDSDLRIMKSSATSEELSTIGLSSEEGDTNPWLVNPIFAQAMNRANVFIGSLIFDYDDVMAVQQLLNQMPKSYPKFIFESATELMSYNQVGSFSMMTSSNSTSTKAGPPPFVKAILSKFGSNKEEDKLAGYLQLLKIGPDILQYVPGNTAQDLRTWMSVYRYWNQGGTQNIQSMFQLIVQEYNRLVGDVPSPTSQQQSTTSPQPALPQLVVTPDIGLVHPLVWIYKIPNVMEPNAYFHSSPAEYLRWRLSQSTKDFARQHNYILAPDSAPRVAVLLFRKHVITDLKYIPDMLSIMEQQGIIPIPIFINGVEAHTIVRDLLTSEYETNQVLRYRIQRESTYQRNKAVSVDAIVNTIGFPLVGGPAGSMEAGRNVAVASQLLSSMNVPYIIASPLLLQTIPQWQSNGVLGLQSVVLYSLPELDGAIDTVVIGGLVGDKIALIPERVRKLTSRINGWVRLRHTPSSERTIAICLYGFPPNVGAVGTAALLNVPKSLDLLLRKLHDEGYNTGSYTTDPYANGESIVAALSILCENPVISAGADRMEEAVQNKIRRAMNGDSSVATTLALPGGGLGGAYVRCKNVSPDELEQYVGKYMMKKIRRYWSDRSTGDQPGVSAKGEYVVAGIQVGNVFIFVQPLLGVEGDPMRLLFERNLTPHPQYVATYSLLRQPKLSGGIDAQAIVHLG